MTLFAESGKGHLAPSQKGSPADRTGHTLHAAAQYIQETPKNNGLFTAGGPNSAQALPNSAVG
jgi:hypothetical protein